MYYGFRTVILLVGLACVWMGYRLFVENIQQGGASVSGEIESPEGTKGKIHVGRGGPGICFAFFGAGIIVFGLLLAPKVDKTTTYKQIPMSQYPTPRNSETLKKYGQSLPTDTTSELDRTFANTEPMEDKADTSFLKDALNARDLADNDIFEMLQQNSKLQQMAPETDE